MPLREADARAALQKLLDDFHKLSDDDRLHMSEASVVRQFVDRLLEEVLGWPIKDPARYKYELSTTVGRPDLTLIPEKGGVIFVEAKRFGVIKELKEARFTVQGVITPGQMALPGMAVDRTPEEQQAINYAFANGGTWAILTNFEKLRLFNARRDWLVLSFERPGAYLTEFDQLWQLAYDNVVNGSLDALSNQRYARDIDSEYLAFINEWREKLARDIISRPHNNRWAFTAEGEINLPRLRAVIQRFLDRMVVARFAEDWLVIPPGTLRQFYEIRTTNLYTLPMDNFLDAFFRRFDDEHNSALFAESLVDYASFGDGALLPLIDKLYEVRYRAMPADILGNTYEQYLGKTLAVVDGSISTRDNLETRKKQGSYYTPQVIVQHMVDHSLGRYLYASENGKPDGTPIPGERRKTSQDIIDLRVLDSACGSGSFLIYAYQVLAAFYESEITRLEAEREQRVRQMAANFADISLDDRVAMGRIENELERIGNYPRLILETHLYGVDLDPQAAEIAVVNLMMRAMEGQNREKRLPLILGQNVKVGNGLVGLRPDDPQLSTLQTEIGELIAIRRLLTTDPDRGQPQPERKRDYYHDMTLDEALQIPNPSARLRAFESVRQRIEGEYHDPEISDLAQLEIYDPAHKTYYELLRKTRDVADKLDAEIAPHFSDLSRVRPFHWGIEFPEVFYNEDGTPRPNPGFDIILGNPPWEIVKPDLREYYSQFDANIESRYNRQQVEQRIEELNAEDPRRKAEFDGQTLAAEQLSAYSRRSPDFTRQGRGDTGTHKLFLERMYGLLNQGGHIGYVVPSGIYSDLGTKPLREMLLDQGNIQYIFSFSNERGFFIDVHHAMRFALLGAQKGVLEKGFWAAFRFDPRVAVSPNDLPAFLDDPSNRIYIPNQSIIRFSPDNFSILEFENQQQYEVCEKIYDDWPLLGNEIADKWNSKLAYEFHTTNDSEFFSTDINGWPLYEGRMIDQYDHRAGYWVSGHGRSAVWHYSEGNYSEDSWRAQYYIDEDIAQKRQVDLYGELKWRLGLCLVTAPTNRRTVIGSILPMESGVAHSIATFTVNAKDEAPGILLFCLSVFNSLVFDYLLRFRVKLNLGLYMLQESPVPRLTAGNPFFDALVPRAARLVCTRAEFAGLWREVMGESQQSPPPTPPHAWGGETGEGINTRQTLRDEIDAVVAHLYGLTREDFAHILGTFPLVFPDTAEGRAKRESLLATYDAWGGRLG